MKKENSDFEPEFESLVKTIDSLDELPDEVNQQVNEFKKKITDMVLESKSGSDKKDSCFAIIDFLAFQQFQIHSLQREIQSIHQILLQLAKAIDSKAERINW